MLEALMTYFWVRIALVALLTVVAIWGMFTAVRVRKSAPTKGRFYGVYLRTCLFVGALACLVGALLLTINLLSLP